MTTLTVVIPYFNGMRTIERALASIDMQSTAPAEVIVVNDGSDSENSAFVHALAKRQGFRVLDRPNGGQGAARNDGIRAAATPFVCLLDQDDFYTPDHIEKLLAVALSAKSPKLGFVYSDVSRGTEAGTITVEGVIASSGRSHPLPSVRDMLARDIMILPSSMLLHRDNILQLGGFDERFVGFEDDDLVIRCHLAGLTTAFVPESLSVWTLNRESASFSPRMSESRWLFFTKLVETFLSHHENLVGEVIAPRFVRAFLAELLLATSKGTPAIDSARDRLKAAKALLRGAGLRIPLTLISLLNGGLLAPRFILPPLYALYSGRQDRRRTSS